MAKQTGKKAPAKKTGKNIKGKGSDSKKKLTKTSAKPAAKTASKSKPAVKKIVKKAEDTKVKNPKTKMSKTKSTDKKGKPERTMAKKKTEEKKVTAKKVSAKSKVKETPVPEVPKVVKPIKGYSKTDLEHFRKIIMDKRDEIIEQLQNLKEQMLDPTTGEYINENSPYSLHMAEQGTDAMEREKTFLYAQRENKFLGYLEDALKRIDSGTYGICVECIDEPQHLCETCPLVPKARLEAVPHSQLCLPIKQRQEKYK
jgi:DnaK suppressor protein